MTYLRPDEMHPRTPRKLTDIVTKVLFIIFEESWKPGDLPSYQRKGNITFILKRGVVVTNYHSPQYLTKSSRNLC